jgi:beta-galactosidase GanA
MFVFGTQYLRGATPLREDWDRDFARMAEHGFNTVRAWIVWNTVEKSEGEVDFDYLGTFLDAAGTHGVRVGLLFHLHAAPEWLIRKHPEYFYVTAEGRAFEPSNRPNTPSGGWPGLCYDNPEVREVERRFITTVVRGLAGRKEIAFWEPMNEPHQWVDLARDPVGHFCYCPASRRRFREWLQRHYGSLEALSEAWGRHHNDWEEVRPPTWRFGYTDYIDFRRFTMDNVADECRFRSEIVKGLDSRPVIAHAWGGGAIQCTNIGAMAFDDWTNASLFPSWGYSAFPSTHHQNVIVGLCTDSTRGAAMGKEIWQAELGPGDVGSGLNRRGRVKPEVMAGWSWESIRHGAKGLLYWQYRKEAHGVEFASPGLTDYDGEPTELLVEAGRISGVLQTDADLFNRSRVEPARVALVLSMRTYLVDWCDNRQSQLAIDSMSGYYRMFWEDNVPVDILHEDHMDAALMRGYGLVVLPFPAALSRNARAALSEYVRAGGTILSDPYFSPYTDNFWLDTRVPGGGYDEVFGCREKDIFRAEGPVSVRHQGRSYAVAGGHFREEFRLAGGTAVATYADGAEPAVVSNSWGKGRAIILGLNLGLAYSPRLGVGDDFVREDARATTGGAKALTLALVESLGIRGAFRSDCSDLRGGFLRGPGAEDLFIVTNGAEEPRRATLEIGEDFLAFTDLTGGASGRVERGSIGLGFGPLETRVLKLRRRG